MADGPPVGLADDPSTAATDDLPGSEEVWRTINDHISRHGMARHQIESFNGFINSTLHKIITENSDVTSMTADKQTSYHLQFCNTCVHKPTSQESEGFEFPLLPHAARLRGLTYASTVTVDLVHDKVDRRASKPKIVWRKVYRSVVLCRLPIMCGSDACHLKDASKRGEECTNDRGGMATFVINGHEKTLICQEKVRTNVPFVWLAPKGTKYGHVCEVRSCHELKLRSSSTTQLLTIVSKSGGLPDIVVKLPFLQTTIPLPTLFRVLGATTREEALQYIPIVKGDDEVRHICHAIFDADTHAGTTQEDAFEWLGRETTREVTPERRSKYCLHIIGNECLPHIGLRVERLCNQRKLHFVGFMIARLLDVHLRRKAPDDRDDYSNKRVDSAGALMSLLTRQLFRAFLKSISVAQARLVETGKIDSTPFGDVVSDRRISSGFKYAMATGVWNSAKSGLGGSSQTGVAQVVSRMTALSTQSNLRRINTPISREGKCPKPRQLHPTSWGIICASESPEGSGCGLVKNLALLAMVRSGVLSTPIAESILHSSATRVVPLLVATKAERDDGAMVFVNGVTIGFCARADASALVAELRTKRRQQQLPADMSVSHSGRFVLVASDPGALLRPVIIASEVHRFNRVCRETPAYANTFDTLLQAGVIEFLDKDEERDCRIAVRATDLARGGYTHLELDPAAILGVMGNCVPFANHDQAPRVTYQCAMGKQACGVPTTNWLRRMDALSHVQLSPMVPLVSTRAEQALGSESVPSGANIIVCVLAHGGFNQEDSLILNKASVERGLFRTLCHRSIKDEEKQGADREIFENPLTSREPVASMRVGRYDRLESGGFVVAPGAAIERDVCIIAKTISTSDVVAEQNESRTTVKRDKSVLYRHTEPANVDMVLHTRTRDGSRAVRVRTRAVRQPKVGDKFSSRHGQKGVVGQLCDEMQMPYCPRTGLRPDLIVNPHALPSRMTIGQMLEQLLGILCTHTGEIGDGTPFRGTTPQAIGDMLEQAGLQRNGNRMMVDGHTGEQLPMLCFISPCFYQRLKHMSSDKIHARSRGPCQILTRQPLEGRSSQGGLRFGEMERDCLISHGAASVLQEFLLLKSDAFEALLCAKCGLLAVPKDERAHVRHSAAHCRACGSTDCVRKTLPYAMKLLMQELMGMHIGARLRLDQKEAPACEMAATAL